MTRKDETHENNIILKQICNVINHYLANANQENENDFQLTYLNEFGVTSGLLAPKLVFSPAHASEDGYGDFLVAAPLYYFKMWDSGTLVRDMIPCKDGSGQAGMYDKVNGKFYGSSSNASFIAGPEIIDPIGEDSGSEDDN